MHRFHLSGVDSEFAPDGSQNRSVPASCDRTFVGNVLAVGFLFKPVAENIGSTTASAFGQRFSHAVDWFGGVFMQLKLFALSASSIVLWLVPPIVLDKKLDINKALQGVSLCAAVACAVSAGNIARKLAEESEIELIKERALKADVMDEISTSVYVSQQQRQQEAEQILNPVERLERLLALTHDEGERSTQNQLAEPEQNAESERAERALQSKAKGWGKAKIILEIWGVSKGGSQKYKDAETEYDRIIEDK